MNAAHLVVFCSSEVSRPEKRDLLPGQGLIPAQESVWLTEAVFSQADLWSCSVSFILSLVRNSPTHPTPKPTPLPLLSTQYSSQFLPLSSWTLGLWRKRNCLNKDSFGKCPKLATCPGARQSSYRLYITSSSGAYLDPYGEKIFNNPVWQNLDW